MSSITPLARAAASLLLVTGAAACAGSAAAPAGPVPPASSYDVYVANEASDLVTRLHFTPGGALSEVRSIGVGEPGRIAGPHGLAVAPDGSTWYVSLSHGTPNGRVRKYDAARDSIIATVGVGLFPETVTITPDGQYIFLTNQDLHGTGSISGVSVVYAPTMTEVARPNTCMRPQGGRLNATSATHFSVCGRSDQLVAIDTRTFAVTQRFALTPRREQPIGIDVRGAPVDPAAGRCIPVWAEPGRGARAGFVYVACRASDEVLEIDATLWQVTRRFSFDTPGRMAIDPAGARLLITLPADSALAALDLQTGAHRRIATSRAEPHAITVSGDGRFAFVTNEGSGAARGTVDVIDMATLERVASAEVGYSPGAVGVALRR